MGKINIKTPEEVELMRLGGEKLRQIKEALGHEVGEGVSASDIESMADDLIKKSGGKSSFKMVPGYRWNTCVNVNDGVVHGIPHSHIVFKKGDVVSVDVGLYYKGFHTDTSISVAIGSEHTQFLNAGKESLKAGIKVARKNNHIYDISEAIGSVLEKRKLTPIRALVGHGVGRQLHEEPYIPCFASGRRESTPRIDVGAVFAIEVMYTNGSGDVYIDDADKWTIATKDGKISALFEETVAVTSDGPLILT